MVKKRVKRRSLAKKRRVLNNQKNQIQISRMLSLQQADEATQTSEKGIAIENEQEFVIHFLSVDILTIFTLKTYLKPINCFLFKAIRLFLGTV